MTTVVQSEKSCPYNSGIACDTFAREPWRCSRCGWHTGTAAARAPKAVKVCPFNQGVACDDYIMEPARCIKCGWRAATEKGKEKKRC